MFHKTVISFRTKLLLVLPLIALSAFSIAANPATVQGHSGEVAATQTCQSWSASVTLDNNVTSDRTVDVITTIPGTVGITNGHYNATYGLIWSKSGTAPTTGTVTLDIYNGTNLEFSTSATLPTPNCPTPTPTQKPTPTPTPVVTPSPTPTPPPCTIALFSYDKSGSEPYPMLKVNVWATAGSLAAGCSMSFSLNSYTTQGATWATTGTQSLFDHESITLNAANPSGTLTVKDPTCYGQTDFYSGTTRFDGIDGALPHYPDSVVPQPLIAWSNGGSACSTPTPTPTQKPTPTPTPVVTPSPTPVVTPSPTPVVTPSPTPVVTPSPTPVVTPSPTPVVTPSPTPVVTPSPTPVVTPSPTPPCSCSTPTPTPVVTPSPTPVVTPSPTPVVTPVPTSTSSAKPNPSPSSMPETTTGDSGSDNGGLRIILIGLAFMVGAAGYAIVRRSRRSRNL